MLKFIINKFKGFIVLKQDRYLEVLKEFNTPVTLLTWASKLIEQYPSILKQINSKTNELMTLQALVTNLSLKVSKGEFTEVKVLESQPYRKVLFVSDKKRNELIKQEVYQDILSVVIEEKRATDVKKATESDKYRLEELKNITQQLNKYFSLNFVLHHALSLSNERKQGKHHADNLEILSLEHSLLKRDGDKKFSIEEQKGYIKRMIAVHMMIDKSIEINLTDEVLEMLLDRLEKVY